MQEQKKTPGTSARTQTRKRDYRKELSSGSPAATEASAHGCLHRVAIDGAYHHLRRQASKAHTESMHPGLRASGVHLLEPGLLVRSDHSLQRPERHQNTNRGYKRTGTTPAHVTVSLPCPVRGMPSLEPCGSLSLSLDERTPNRADQNFLTVNRCGSGPPRATNNLETFGDAVKKLQSPQPINARFCFPHPSPPGSLQFTVPSNQRLKSANNRSWSESTPWHLDICTRATQRCQGRQTQEVLGLRQGTSPSTEHWWATSTTHVSTCVVARVSACIPAAVTAQKPSAPMGSPSACAVWRRTRTMAWQRPGRPKPEPPNHCHNDRDGLGSSNQCAWCASYTSIFSPALLQGPGPEFQLRRFSGFGPVLFPSHFMWILKALHSLWSDFL